MYICTSSTSAAIPMWHMIGGACHNVTKHHICVANLCQHSRVEILTCVCCFNYNNPPFFLWICHGVERALYKWECEWSRMLLKEKNILTLIWDPIIKCGWARPQAEEGFPPCVNLLTIKAVKSVNSQNLVGKRSQNVWHREESKSLNKTDLLRQHIKKKKLNSKLTECFFEKSSFRMSLQAFKASDNLGFVSFCIWKIKIILWLFYHHWYSKIGF